MGSINIALIGIGYWGSKLKKYIEENQNFNIKYICNSKYDLNKVWNDKHIIAVVIATRNDTHYSIAKAALLHDKNVLIEKPLALKTKQCEELKQLALSRNLLLMVEYTWTFSKALEKAQNLVKSGEIGKIKGVEMSVKHLGRFKGGSVYWLLGSHMLSVLDMFISINDISFKKNDFVIFEGQVETGLITFQKGDMSGQIVVSLNYPGKETKMIIYGERGTIIYDPFSQPSLYMEKYERLKWTVASKLPRERVDFCIDESNNLRYAMEYFRKALMGKADDNTNRAIAVTRVLETLVKG